MVQCSYTSPKRIVRRVLRGIEPKAYYHVRGWFQTVPPICALKVGFS
jgi:hypothetical protein